MQVYISYFYQVRFMDPMFVPISTAVYDPKWFHENQRQDHLFMDKHGVVNGLRIEPLSPSREVSQYCHGKGCSDSPSSCKFLAAYREQLNNLDFDKIIKCLQGASKTAQKVCGLEQEPNIVLLVYETPSNPCSERQPLIEWFADNGYELKEFSSREE